MPHSVLPRAATNDEKPRRTFFFLYLLSLLRTLKRTRWKNIRYDATVRSDLFYWDVGTSDQFTKCPVKHGGPVIVSMIRTSFRAPMRRNANSLNRSFVTSQERARKLPRKFDSSRRRPQPSALLTTCPNWKGNYTLRRFDRPGLLNLPFALHLFPSIIYSTIKKNEGRHGDREGRERRRRGFGITSSTVFLVELSYFSSIKCLGIDSRVYEQNHRAVVLIYFLFTTMFWCFLKTRVVRNNLVVIDALIR